MFDILDMPCQSSHLAEGCCDLKVIREERGDPFIEDLAKIALIAVLQKRDVARVLIDLPRSEHMLRKLVSINSGVPRRSLVVGQRDHAVGRFAIMAVAKQVLPRQHVPVGIVRFVVRPRSHSNLKCRIVTVHTEEVVDGGLRMRFHLPAMLHIDVVHQVQRPQVIVDVLMFSVRTTKPRDFFVELAIHRARLREHRFNCVGDTA